jgi:RNA polymerase sigma factor (sigma-70 family)
MKGIQAGDPDALSQLYDRYNGILKALILRVIHNEAEADDLLQEIFMEIWNQAKNFSEQKGKPLGWMVTLARRRAIDGLRKKQAYAELSRKRTAARRMGAQRHRRRNRAGRHARADPQGDQRPTTGPAAGNRPRIFQGHEPARNRGENDTPGT